MVDGRSEQPGSTDPAHAVTATRRTIPERGVQQLAAITNDLFSSGN